MRQHQRQMQKERQAAGEVATSGYRGPDQSGQWVSMGELAAGESLDEALGCLEAGASLPATSSIGVLLAISVCWLSCLQSMAQSVGRHSA